jgi:hypothetical protein
MLYGGAQNAGRLAVLEDGMKFSKVSARSGANPF